MKYLFSLVNKNTFHNVIEKLTWNFTEWNKKKQDLKYLWRELSCDTNTTFQAMGALGPGALAVFQVDKEVLGPTRDTPSEPVGVFPFHPWSEEEWNTV